MRILKNIILIICCLLGFAKANAQVTVEAKLDSAGIFIGQRIGMTLEVSADAKSNVELPEWDSLQQVAPGIEFVHAEKTAPARAQEYTNQFLQISYKIPTKLQEIRED